jgi:replicative DNA helicase
LIDPELLFIYDSFTINQHDFYEQSHSVIYSTIKTLQINHKPIDIITIADQLQKDKTYDIAGGEDYLYVLSNTLLSTAPCAEYAKIIKEKSILRNILKTCQKISADVYDQKEPRDIIDIIEKRIFDLTQINIRN